MKMPRGRESSALLPVAAPLQPHVPRWPSCPCSPPLSADPGTAPNSMQAPAPSRRREAAGCGLEQGYNACYAGTLQSKGRKPMTNIAKATLIPALLLALGACQVNVDNKTKEQVDNASADIGNTIDSAA